LLPVKLVPLPESVTLQLFEMLLPAPSVNGIDQLVVGPLTVTFATNPVSHALKVTLQPEVGGGGGGGLWPPPDVVTLVMPEFPDEPAELTACTRYRYVVLAARLLSLNVVPVGVPTWLKLVLFAPVARSTT